MTGIAALGVALIVAVLAFGGIRWQFSSWFRARVRVGWAWRRTRVFWFVTGFVVGVVVTATGMLQVR